MLHAQILNLIVPRFAEMAGEIEEIKNHTRDIEDRLNRMNRLYAINYFLDKGYSRRVAEDIIKRHPELVDCFDVDAEDFLVG